MKKKILATALAAIMAFSAPMTVSAAWQKDDAGSWSWSENGTKATGWKQVDGKWYLFNENGVMQTGWQQVDGKWYFLKSSGAMSTGWKQVNGKWYYMDSSGTMATGWRNVGGKWYYMDSSGAMATGWVKTGDKWYHMDTSGAMQAGKVQVNGETYFLDGKNGDMKTGFITEEGKTYFASNDGALQTGVIQINGKTYALDEETGAIQTGKVKIDGKTYLFGDDGVAIGRTPTADKAYSTTGGTATEVEVTKPSSSSGSSSIGGSGSSGGSNTGGNTGGDSEKPNPPEENPDEKPNPPEEKIDMKNGGTWKDSEEGIQFIADAGTYFWHELYVIAPEVHTLTEIRKNYFWIDSLKVSSFNVRCRSNDLSRLEGNLQYYPENSTDGKMAPLTEVTVDDTTGIFSLTYTDESISCTIQIKFAKDRKSVTLLDMTSDQLFNSKENVKGDSIRIIIDSLPDTTAIVTTEQEIHKALEDKTITALVSGDIEFNEPLVIDRDIEILYNPRDVKWDAPRWIYSENWDLKNQSLIQITNGANVIMNGITCDYLDKYSLDSYIEVNNASLVCGNILMFPISNYGIRAENSSIKIVDYSTIVGNNAAIIMDMADNASSTIILDDSSELGGLDENIIISGSNKSVVNIPNDKYIQGEKDGYYIWTRNQSTNSPKAE